MTELSVIIPTRNRADSLARALESLTTQTLDPSRFEVLVVDNGSSDNTRCVAEAFARRLPALRYVLEERPGLHNGRHRGMREAAAELLVYADDDIEAFPTWLASVLEAFQRPDVALVGGRNLPRFASPPPAWIEQWWQRPRGPGRALPYLSILDFGEEAREISPQYVWGCNFSVRKAVLLEAGGFHPDALPKEMLDYRGDGENWVSDHVERSGYVAFYHPGASVYHCIPDANLTRDYFRARAVNQGISDSFTVIRARAHRENLRRGRPDSPPVNPRRARFLRAVVLAKRILVRLPAFSPAAALRKELYRAGLQGYRRHQARAARDPEFLQWVVRDTYIEDQP